MVLNYKNIPYRESFISYPDIKPLLQSLDFTSENNSDYTLPAITHSVLPKGQKVLHDSLPIALYLDKTFTGPNHPEIFPGGFAGFQVYRAVQLLIFGAMRESRVLVAPRVADILDDKGKDYFVRTRSISFGKPLAEVYPSPEDVEKIFATTSERLLDLIRLLQPIPGQSSAGPFFLGDKPSYADFVVVAYLAWFERGNVELFDRMLKLGHGELAKLYERSRVWVETQGEIVKWEGAGKTQSLR